MLVNYRSSFPEAWPVVGEQLKSRQLDQTWSRYITIQSESVLPLPLECFGRRTKTKWTQWSMCQSNNNSSNLLDIHNLVDWYDSNKAIKYFHWWQTLSMMETPIDFFYRLYHGKAGCGYGCEKQKEIWMREEGCPGRSSWVTEEGCKIYLNLGSKMQCLVHCFYNAYIIIRTIGNHFPHKKCA